MSATNFAILSSLVAIIYGAYLSFRVTKKPSGSEEMRAIARAIQEGANAYLKRQYKAVAVVAAVLFIIIWLALGPTTAVGFLIGAVASALAGFVGMGVAVRANVRTAEAAKSGFGAPGRIPFQNDTPNS